ncbi:hypothetical protein SCA6_008809 [Theobroma cacao]
MNSASDLSQLSDVRGQYVMLTASLCFHVWPGNNFSTKRTFVFPLLVSNIKIPIEEASSYALQTVSSREAV